MCGRCVEHVGPGVFDYVLVNADLGPAQQIKPEWNVQPVTLPADATYPDVEFVRDAGGQSATTPCGTTPSGWRRPC